MPEGDTVRRLADRIGTAVAGRRVERAELRDPRLAGHDLVGRTVTGADAYGKHLFVRFDDGRTLHAHLMMEGSFTVGPPSREPAWKRRAELWFDHGRLTAESVPVLELIRTSDEHRITDRLGPDLCRPHAPPDPDAVADRLAAVPDLPVAARLLDQTIVAGFGNVFVNDVPFIMGVSPLQPVGSIDGLRDLVAVGIALIRTCVELGFQNTTGRRLRSDAHWVHGVGRRPCPVCATRLVARAATDTAWQRSITWCPECQPLTERITADLVRAERLIALHPALREPYLAR